MRLFLIRHGFSQANENPQNYIDLGDSKVPLTEEGWRQAFRAGAFLQTYMQKNNIILTPEKYRLWMSPYMRTRETMSGIMQGAGDLFAGKKARAHDALIEQDFGLFSGPWDLPGWRNSVPVLIEHYERARKQDPYHARPTNGESPADVRRRLAEFKGTLFRDIAEGVENGFAVTHGVTLRALAMSMLHIDPLQYKNFPNPQNTAIYVIEGDKKNDYTFTQIYDGEKEVSIDWGAILKIHEAYMPLMPAHILQSLKPAP